LSKSAGQDDKEHLLALAYSNARRGACSKAEFREKKKEPHTPMAAPTNALLARNTHLACIFG
jgi:hypothetical protein